MLNSSGSKIQTSVINYWFLFQGLATGADSNANGIVALLEIARIFAQLYDDETMKAKYPFDCTANDIV